MNGPLSRREMLGLTAAAVAATPLVKLPADAVVTATPPGKFLTAAELALVDELTELIIPTDDHSPGAKAAGVAAYIDYRLSISVEPDWQAKWRTGLKAVNGLSRDLNGKAFMDATAEQRVAVLTKMAAGEENPKTPEEHFFNELKRWTVTGYYTSSIGIHQDQEYKGNVIQPGEFAGYDAT
ncbi:MAG TPA: gluconate 2-dehydrogenase subunit 3 family protein [Gemmatimonadales bacterium]|nr:gluconate 2-dehydrogenase subunit 3 family protein [Gemmatimonadales bacterium]